MDWLAEISAYLPEAVAHQRRAGDAALYTNPLFTLLYYLEYTTSGGVSACRHNKQLNGRRAIFSVTESTVLSAKTAAVKMFFNALVARGNHSATSNNMKLVHWPLMSELLKGKKGKGKGSV